MARRSKAQKATLAKAAETRREKSKLTAALKAHAVSQPGGVASKFLRLPPDTLFEILEYLKPYDLLCLARANKVLRALLLNRPVSARLWSAAHENVPGLPACEPFMSEPKYANLMFDTHCHNCLAPDVTTVLWESMTRYCAPCKSQFVRCADNEWSVDRGDLSSSRYIPYRRAILDDGMFKYDTREKLRTRPALLPPISECTFEQMQRVMEEEDEATRKEYQYAGRWAAWHTSKRTIEDLLSKRKQTIVGRLRDAGWGHELDLGFDFETLLTPHSLDDFRQYKKLSSSEWQKLETLLTTYMGLAQFISSSLEREFILRQRVIQCVRSHSFLKAHYRGQPFPDFSDFLQFSQVREIVDAPDEADFDRERVSELLPRLPGLLVWWKHDKSTQLADIITRQIDVAEGVDPLDLAAAVFVCTCGAYRWHPDVISHRCLNALAAPADPARDLRTLDDPWGSALARVLPRRPWSPARLTTILAAQMIGEVVSACGMDPRRATREEMDGLECRLHDASTEAGRPKLVRTWRSAVEECLSGSPASWGSRVRRWTQVTPTEAAAVRTIESETKSAQRVFSLNEWCCARCDTRRYTSGMPLAELALHSIEWHELEQVTPVDYYRLLDVRPFAREPVMLP